MSRNWWRIALVVISAAMLQRGVASHVQPFGVAPDLMLLVAVSAGIAAGPERGAVVGFFSGLALDLLLQGPIGLAALSFSLVGYFTGRYEGLITRAGTTLVVLTAFVASVLGELVYVGLGLLVGQANMLSSRLWLIVLVVALVNAALAPLAVRALRWATDDEPRFGPHRPALR
jgi:rod shape-determining protein MreD